MSEKTFLCGRVSEHVRFVLFLLGTDTAVGSPKWPLISGARAIAGHRSKQQWPGEPFELFHSPHDQDKTLPGRDRLV